LVNTSKSPIAAEIQLMNGATGDVYDTSGRVTVAAGAVRGIGHNGSAALERRRRSSQKRRTPRSDRQRRRGPSLRRKCADMCCYLPHCRRDDGRDCAYVRDFG
jgi:hypothetical protein